MSRADLRALRRNAQNEAARVKMEKETEFFWSLVERNRRTQMAPPSLARDREEQILFGSQGSQGINFEKYDQIPVETSGPAADVPPMLDFSELEHVLPPFLLHNIVTMKYVSPTPIQKYSIPMGIAGSDLMCCAQTGSGKTCAFLIPLVYHLHRLETMSSSSSSSSAASSSTTTHSHNSSQDAPRNENSPVSDTSALTDNSPAAGVGANRAITTVTSDGVGPRGLVLAPTRELALQIHLESKKLMFNSSLRSVVVYGGSDMRAQLADLSFGCDIIVATPGRLIDMVERGIVSLSQVSFLVFDEADRMLDMGFEPQIQQLLQHKDMAPKEQRQTLLYSATFSTVIQSLAAQMLREYTWIGVGKTGSTVENILQRVVCAPGGDVNEKVSLTLEALREVEGRTLIFVQMKRTAAWLSNYLRHSCRITSDDIHSDKSQQQREAALRRFREGRVRVLVATDVAARGLDIADVQHVIQFDLPPSPEEFDSYVHRVGRTGRAGHQGIATALYTPGYENGGNRRIAHLIYTLMEENNQTIPEWFAEEANNHGAPAMQHSRPHNNTSDAFMFNSRDIRSQYQTSVGFARPAPINTHSHTMTPMSPATYPVAASFSNASPHYAAGGGVYLLTPNAYVQQPTHRQQQQQQQQYVMPMARPQQQYYVYAPPQYAPQQQYYAQSQYEYMQPLPQHMISPSASQQAQYSVEYGSPRMYGQLPPQQQPHSGASPRTGHHFR